MSRARHMKASSTVMAKPSPAGEPAVAIPGKAVMEESKAKSKGFKRGGKVAMSAGGECPPGKQRMDKVSRKARGGSVTMRGRSPLSAASSASPASTKTSH